MKEYLMLRLLAVSSYAHVSVWSPTGKSRVRTRDGCGLSHICIISNINLISSVKRSLIHWPVLLECELRSRLPGLPIRFDQYLTLKHSRLMQQKQVHEQLFMFEITRLACAQCDLGPKSSLHSSFYSVSDVWTTQSRPIGSNFICSGAFPGFHLFVFFSRAFQYVTRWIDASIPSSDPKG